uniref:LemA family protein n=1 Tax=Syphacia muris TaxID=451379 RepID=A0A0N5AK35_9BILA
MVGVILLLLAAASGIMRCKSYSIRPEYINLIDAQNAKLDDSAVSDEKMSLARSYETATAQIPTIIKLTKQKLKQRNSRDAGSFSRYPMAFNQNDFLSEILAQNMLLGQSAIRI